MATVSGSPAVPHYSLGKRALDVVTSPVWVPWYGAQYGWSAVRSVWSFGKAHYEIKQAAKTPPAPQEFRAILGFLKQPTASLAVHRETLAASLHLLENNHPWFSELKPAEKAQLKRLLVEHQRELAAQGRDVLQISETQKQLAALLEKTLSENSAEERVYRVVNTAIPGMGDKLKAVNTLTGLAADLTTEVQHIRAAHDTPPPPPELQNVLEFLQTSTIASGGQPLRVYLARLQTCLELFERNHPWVQRLSQEDKRTLHRLLLSQRAEAEEEVTDPTLPIGPDEENDLFADCLSDSHQELRDFLIQAFLTYKPLPQMKQAGLKAVEKAFPGLLPSREPGLGVGGISAMMGTVAPILGDLMTTLANAALQSASAAGKKTLAGWLLAAFEATVATVPANTENPDTLALWRTCLKDLIEGKGSWSSLLKLFDAGKIRCWGMRIPGLPEASLDAAAAQAGLPSYRDQSRILTDLVTAHQAIYATPLPVQVDPLRRQQAGFERDQKAFIDNTAHLLTFKWMSEIFLPPDKDSDYLTAVKAAIHPQDSTLSTSQLLKDNLIQKIRSTRIAWSVSWVSGWFKEVFAKALWWIYASALHHFIERVCKHHTDQIFAFIDKGDREGFKGARSGIIECLNGYFHLLSKVYAKAATENGPGLKTYEKEIDDLIKSMNTDLDALYTQFFDLEFKAAVPDNWIGRMGLWIFQALFNWFHGGKKEVIQSLSKLAIASLSDANGYKHPLNTLLLERLQDIRRKMQDSTLNSGSMEGSELKEREKEQLSILAKHLFNILPKQACQNKEELQRTYDPLSFAGLAKEAWVLPPIVEKTTVVVSGILDAIASKKWLTDMVYDAMYLATQIYEPTLPTIVTAEQTSKELTDTTTALLTLAIKQTVNDIFDSSQKAKEENKRVNLLIANLKAKTTDFVAEMQYQIDHKGAAGIALASLTQRYVTWAANAKSAYEADPLLKGSEATLNQKFASNSELRAPLVNAIAELLTADNSQENSDRKLQLLHEIGEQTQAFLRELRKENPNFSHISALQQKAASSAIVIPPGLQPENIKLSLQVMRDAHVLLGLQHSHSQFPLSWPNEAIHLIGLAVVDEKQAARLTALVKAAKNGQALQTSMQTAIATTQRALSNDLTGLQQSSVLKSAEVREAKYAEARRLDKPALVAQIQRDLNALRDWATRGDLRAEPLINIEPVRMRVIHEYLRGLLEAQLEPVAKDARRFISSDSFFEHGLLEAVALKSYVTSHHKV